MEVNRRKQFLRSRISWAILKLHIWKIAIYFPDTGTDGIVCGMGVDETSTIVALGTVLEARATGVKLAFTASDLKQHSLALWLGFPQYRHRLFSTLHSLSSDFSFPSAARLAL